MDQLDRYGLEYGVFMPDEPDEVLAGPPPGDDHYGPDPVTGIEPPYEADYAREATEHHMLQAQVEWSKNVQDNPGVYNFIYQGICDGPKIVVGYDGSECSGLLNSHGECEFCVAMIGDMIEQSERAAGWDPNP